MTTIVINTRMVIEHTFLSGSRFDGQTFMIHRAPYETEATACERAVLAYDRWQWNVYEPAARSDVDDLRARPAGHVVIIYDTGEMAT